MTFSFQLEPYIPYEFTTEGYLERLSVYVQNQDFCHCSGRRWPPISAMITHLGAPGQSCTEVCQQKGKS